jgi:hypothetical protein
MKMLKNGFVVCFLIISISTYSQQNGSNQTTSLNGGRWEFFMSDVAVRYTFKIDKFTGDVFQYVKREDETYTWQIVEKYRNVNDIVKENVINYQLFSSGQGIRYTFLLNTNSGLTWKLVSTKDGGLIFEDFE